MMGTSEKQMPNFDNTEVAFRSKSDQALNASYWLFKMISSNFLTRVGPPVTNFMLRIGLPVKGLIKATIFKHFCGGEDISECEPTIAQLYSGKVGTILDYSVEGEEKESVFDFTCQEIMRTIERAAEDPRIPITVFKVTGIGRFELLSKLDAGLELNGAEETEFSKLSKRCESICRKAYEKKVAVMIDAEETWIQKTIDKLAMNMMRLFNKEIAIVYNTYQMYRHDKLIGLKNDHEASESEGFILGVKMVRGAYMEKERSRALSMGYPSPIQADKAATDYDFNESLRYCVSHIDNIAFVCGTHNEASCRLLAQLLNDAEIPHDHPHVYFSQLLGMSDNLSFNLSHSGYNVAKYVPYGPVKAVMPYLFRRAQENTSIAGQSGRELNLLLKEKKRRAVN